MKENGKSRLTFIVSFFSSRKLLNLVHCDGDFIEKAVCFARRDHNPPSCFPTSMIHEIEASELTKINTTQCKINPHPLNFSVLSHSVVLAVSRNKFWQLRLLFHECVLPL